MDDVAAIREIALDYVQGWFEGDSRRMVRALHPDLVKRGVFDGRISTLGAAEMIEYTVQGGGRSFTGDNPVRVTVIDVFNSIAAVKIESGKYMDYLHLVKAEEKWKILNVLWMAKQ
jgi:hypothetical protein